MQPERRPAKTIMGYSPFQLPEPPVDHTRVMQLEPAVVVAGELLVPSPPPTATASHSDRADRYPLAPRRIWPIALAGSIVVAAVIVVASVFFWSKEPAPRPVPSYASANVALPLPVAAARPASPPPAPLAAARPASPPPAPVVTPATPTPPTPSPALAIDHGSCTLRVESGVSGSVVMIDGRAIAEAPLDVDGLYCGRRVHVTVANPHYAPWDRWVVPEEAKPLRVRADLRRLTTAVAVTSVPSGAIVRIGGHDVATTPAAIAVDTELATTIEVTFPGYVPFKQRIVPHAGATTTIVATLSAQAPAPAGDRIHWTW